MTPVEQRPYIKCLYVSKYVVRNGNRVQYDIAVITTGDKYTEYEVVIRQTSLTYWVLQRMKQLFSNYRMDSRTDVVVSDTIDQYDIMSLYLTSAQVFLGFRFHMVPFDGVFRRICNRYPRILKTRTGKYVNLDEVHDSRKMM